jgi:hypothetical protein
MAQREMDRLSMVAAPTGGCVAGIALTSWDHNRPRPLDGHLPRTPPHHPDDAESARTGPLRHALFRDALEDLGERGRTSGLFVDAETHVSLVLRVKVALGPRTRNDARRIRIGGGIVGRWARDPDATGSPRTVGRTRLRGTPEASRTCGCGTNARGTRIAVSSVQLRGGSRSR